MTINAELFVEDPTLKNIPNLGVAKVGDPTDETGWNVLRYELTSFVCAGEYERGLDRILSSFLGQVGAEQPAAWVSGFYGSGKSHLVRVLEYLWRDVDLPDGSTARGLVRVTPPVTDALRELSTVGKRNGGLWSAAGTLGSGAGSVRLGFLSVVLSAAGLPEQVAQAQCVMWLRDEGLLDQVKEDIEARGLPWDLELDNMYVSQLAEAILAARPGWAPGPDHARLQIQAQFPEREDISLHDTVKMVEKVLFGVSDQPGKLPCSLIVLDEMQQFINEDPDRAQQVQLLVEACSSGFGGLLLIVATGQSALQTTATLQKLIDRFGVQVQLSDADVESVIREVVLRKRPDRIPELEAILELVAGEIDRQLAGARIAPVPADQIDLVPDYPLLPSRRRFWEEVLRAVDKGGKSGQLRTQLKVVHEAARRVAPEPVGTVVPADFIFGQQAPGMLQTGVLLREIEQLIVEEGKAGHEGPLRARILAMVFLISQLSREGFADTGVRATAPHIADLLIDDLTGSGEQLRRDVPRILEELRDQAKLQRVDDEYQLQTRAGQEWTKDFRIRLAAFLSDAGRVAAAREKQFREAVTKLVPASAPQGASKTPRKVAIHFGDVQPTFEDVVPVWVRNGWDLTDKQFSDLATGAGTDSPVVFVYLPKHEADALKQAQGEFEAARETLDTRARPTTNEGLAAQSAMESTARLARDRADGLLRDILSAASVAQAGGTRIDETDLARSIQAAVGRSLDRLFPRFGEADDAAWGTAFSRAQQGNADCLEAVGFSGQVTHHPVCQAVLDAISGVGTSGNDLRKKFETPPFGWPRDAVHGALAALLIAGDISAEENGSPITVRDLSPTKMGKDTFRREKGPIPLQTRLAVRQILTEAGLAVQQNEESAVCNTLLQHLLDLAESIGGEPPLPLAPNAPLITELRGLKGNDLIIGVHDRRDEIRALIKDWNRRASLVEPRLQAYQEALRLAAQSLGLEEARGLVNQLDAVAQQRRLLDIPDPVAPLAASLSDVLRIATRSAIARYGAALSAALGPLDADQTWAALADEQRRSLLESNGLVAITDPDLGTPTQVLAAIEARSLDSWPDRIDVLGAHVDRAREQAARLLEPMAVRIVPPSGSIRSADDIDAYLERLRESLVEALADHKSIII